MSYTLKQRTQASAIAEAASLPATEALHFLDSLDGAQKYVYGGSSTINTFPSVASFNGRSGAIAPQQSDYDPFFLTPAEGNAAYDAAGAASTAQAFAIQRANHTGTQAAGTITGLAAIATSGSASDLAAGAVPAARMPALTGDVTSTVGTVATTIGANKVLTTMIADANVTNAKLANMAAATFKGSVAGGVPADVAAATVLTTIGAQPLDTTLTNLAAQNWVADSIPVGSGADTVTQLAIAANTIPGRASTGGVLAKAFADVAFAFCALTTVAAQTASLNAATTALKGLQSAVDKLKSNNIYTDAVAELLIDPTGNTDAAPLIQAWHDALPASGGATLFIPDNCFARLASNVNFTKPDIRVFANNRRTSGFLLTHATANGFTCSADTAIFENLRFIGGVAGAPSGSGSVRSGGYAVEFTSTGDSGGCINVDAVFMWSCFRSSGPLQFFENVTCREYGANAINGACLLIDGNGDRYVRRMLTDSTAPSAGHAGIRVAQAASLVIDSCNIIHAGLALDLSPANGITVPSIECLNTFFDTSVVGLNCTGAGTVARSQFTNCWFSSMSDSGIKLGPTGTGTVTGLSFVNCSILNNVGGTTVGINITSALVGKLEFIGCKVAGWTTGVSLLAGAAFFPKFSACVVGGYGIFGNNTTGFNIPTGTYLGIHIANCDVVDNTTPFTLGTVTATGTKFRILDNSGINPRGATGITAPAIGAAGTVHTNNTGFRIHALVKFGATAPATTVVNGVASAAGLANQLATIVIEPGGTVQFTTTAPTSWVWSGM